MANLIGLPQRSGALVGGFLLIDYWSPFKLYGLKNKLIKEEKAAELLTDF